ncbi:hypothetical protein KQX54_011796 [Cotesia glomerata]|uniref:C2H2-type domain-containing protein n=1 Tax=Cotesia glomerata TaxID=32391 RepID=A0AAV7I4B9_COTGL|nr:hypothetical protein KQX54_011796 [Cotesia glomerata]
MAMEGNQSIVKYSAGSEDIVVPVINRRRKKPNGQKRVCQCGECLYKSYRSFNVKRHHARIHCKKIIKQCCGKIFRTKGDWYYHIEDFHPSLRARYFTSKQKYQILGSQCSSFGSKRRSHRIKEKLESKHLLELHQFNKTGSLADDLDELPLYYRLKYPQSRGDSNYQSPEDYQLASAKSHRQIELKIPGKIDFPPGFASDCQSSGITSLLFASYIIDNDYHYDKLVDYSDDTEFTKSLTISKVDYEDILEQVVQKEAQEIIWKDRIDNNYCSEFKIQSVKQEDDSNIWFSPIETDGASLDSLPPKKRILRQCETDVVSSSVCQQVKNSRSLKTILKGSYGNDENINPNENKSIKKETENSFLDYFDFDRFKILRLIEDL